MKRCNFCFIEVDQSIAHLYFDGRNDSLDKLQPHCKQCRNKHVKKCLANKKRDRVANSGQMMLGLVGM